MRTAVVAACNNLGIGKDGQLPWTLRKEMAYFKRITTTTKTPGKQNAVVMGRVTWESIPDRFKPLTNRVNIVVSRTLQEPPHEGVHLARSVREAVAMTTGQGALAAEVEDTHIIGGASIYKEAFSGGLLDRVYLTRVLADFECDVFLPPLPETFAKISVEGIDEEEQEENGVKYRYEVYHDTSN